MANSCLDLFRGIRAYESALVQAIAGPDTGLVQELLSTGRADPDMLIPYSRDRAVISSGEVQPLLYYACISGLTKYRIRIINELLRVTNIPPPKDRHAIIHTLLYQFSVHNSFLNVDSTELN